VTFRKSLGVERNDFELFDFMLLGFLMILCGIDKQFQQIALAVSLSSRQCRSRVYRSRESYQLRQLTALSFAQSESGERRFLVLKGIDRRTRSAIGSCGGLLMVCISRNSI
jgi:hypothetical protein